MVRAPLGFVLLLAGCASQKAPEPKASQEHEEAQEASNHDEAGLSEETVPLVDGFFMTNDAPKPMACKVDGDCMGDTVPDPANPCCADPYSLRAHAVAYRDYISAWRSEHCEEVACPPPPAPTRPPDCAFEVRCEAGTCRDACGE